MSKRYVLVEFNYDVGEVAEQLRDAIAKKYNAEGHIRTVDVTKWVKESLVDRRTGEKMLYLNSPGLDKLA